MDAGTNRVIIVGCLVLGFRLIGDGIYLIVTYVGDTPIPLLWRRNDAL
jgi:hypothetical protein